MKEIGALSRKRRLFVEVVEQASAVVVRLDGVIDEDNALADALTGVTGRAILLHAAKVSLINSCGVRDWVRWLARLEADGNSVFLVLCPPPLVAQVNMVRNFCGERGQVVSFLAPYYCEACDREHLERLMPSQVTSTQAAAEVFCVTCSEQLLFDDLPGSFFAFVPKHAAAAVPYEVRAIADGVDAAYLANKVAEFAEVSSGKGLGSAASTPKR